MNKNKISVRFSSLLLSWYKKEKRKLPFRESKSPYKIWLSEIILQQTQMKTGVEYFKVFLKNFPRVEDLAFASEKKIYSLWQGLGYYNRAKNLHKTAKIIVNQNDGVFPKTHKELIKLPGVGKYTAAAISSICYNERRLVVDANVYRVLSRYFGIKKDIMLSKSFSYFLKISEQLTCQEINIGDYNEAIMDFGGLICLPKKPKCNVCVLNKKCIANLTKTQTFFPVKNKVKQKKERYFNYFVLENKTFYLMRKRSNKDIWLNLNEFYLLEEKNKKLAIKSFIKKLNKIKIQEKNITEKKAKGVLSHQNINVWFFKIFIPEKKALTSIKKRLKLKLVNKKDINNYAVPKVIDNYLKCHG